MYDVVKSVIEDGGYSLNAVLDKIDKLWVKGKLTDDQQAELIKLAQDNADPMIDIELAQTVAQLSSRLSDAEARLDKLELPQTDETSEAGTPAYPEWKTGNIAYKGDRYIYKGVLYECIAPDGMPCTWNPDKKPDYWKEVTGNV